MATVNMPISTSTVSVSIIDSTAWAYHIPCADLFKPPFKGLHTLDICSYSFLITHTHENKRRNILFDLGIRKDWRNHVPPMISRLQDWGTEIVVRKHVAEVLTDNGFNPEEVEAIIWSHLHWDHTGSPSTFPPSTKVVFGPGITDRYMPGWPTVADAGFKEADLANREVVELSEKNFNTSVGGFKALDYFGDGSFYTLNAPGHSLGHLNALARTTSDPDTDIFLAADSVHLGGEIRPSELLPLPDTIDVTGIKPRPCPSENILDIHPLHSKVLPFHGLYPCFPEDLEAAEQTIKLIQKLDADERVFVIFTHDTSIYNIVDFYPRVANTWKANGWKDKSVWSFLPYLQKVAKNSDESTEPISDTPSRETV